MYTNNVTMDDTETITYTTDKDTGVVTQTSTWLNTTATVTYNDATFTTTTVVTNDVTKATISTTTEVITFDTTNNYYVSTTTEVVGAATSTFVAKYNDTYMETHSTSGGVTADTYQSITNVATSDTVNTATYMFGTVADNTKWYKSKVIVTTSDSDGMVTDIVENDFTAAGVNYQTITYHMAMADDGSMTETTTTVDDAITKTTGTNTTKTDADGNVNMVIISIPDGTTIASTVTTDIQATDDGLWTTTSVAMTGGATPTMSSQSIKLAYQSAFYNVALSAVAAFALAFATFF